MIPQTQGPRMRDAATPHITITVYLIRAMDLRRDRHGRPPVRVAEPIRGIILPWRDDDTPPTPAAPALPIPAPHIIDARAA